MSIDEVAPLVLRYIKEYGPTTTNEMIHRVGVPEHLAIQLVKVIGLLMRTHLIVTEKVDDRVLLIPVSD
jgi:hypothetical protein